MNPHWYLMTAIMPLCFTVCITLIILQTKSIKWYSNENQLSTRKREIFCLYGQYVIGGMCAIQCFMCHISNFFPEYYCIYGMPICVIIYAATKSCLYGFLLERSKCVQSTFIKLLPPFVWTYIFPSYIAMYFITYLIVCPLTFRGEVVDPSIDTSVPTACLFGQFTGWVFTLSAFIDVFNSICFLFLFMWPIYDLIKKKRHVKLQKEIACIENTAVTAPTFEKDLREIIKYNIICSIICCFTSVTLMCIIAFSKYDRSIRYYIWLGGNIDVMTNSISLFLMPISNRRYVQFLYSKYIKKEGKGSNSVRENIDEETKNNEESTNAVTSANSDKQLPQTIMMDMTHTVNIT